jgi:hypothetical protein
MEEGSSDCWERMDRLTAGKVHCLNLSQLSKEKPGPPPHHYLITAAFVPSTISQPHPQSSSPTPNHLEAAISSISKGATRFYFILHSLLINTLGCRKICQPPLFERIDLYFYLAFTVSMNK